MTLALAMTFSSPQAEEASPLPPPLAFPHMSIWSTSTSSVEAYILSRPCKLTCFMMATLDSAVLGCELGVSLFVFVLSVPVPGLQI